MPEAAEAKPAGRSPGWAATASVAALVERRDLVGGACLILAAPTMVFPGAWTLPGALLLGAYWGLRWAAGGRPFSGIVDWPVALLATWTIVGTIVSSVPAASASKAWGLALGISACYAAARVSGLQRQMRAAWGLVGLGVAVALTALVGTDWTNARVVHHPTLDAVYNGLPRLIRGLPGSGLPGHGELFSPREVGGTLGLLMPLALALAWAERGWRRLWLSLGGGVIGVVLVLTQTPSAVVGVLAATWLGLSLVDSKRRGWWLLGGPGLGLVGLGLAWSRLEASGLLSGGGLSARVSTGPEHNVLGLAARLEIWPRALQMLYDAPYTGIGLNTFPWVMDRFYPGYILGPEVHAHHFWLQVGVDFGLPGLVAVTWLMLAWTLALAGVWQAASERRTRALVLGLGGGLLAHLIFGLLDTVTLGAKPGLALWLMLGLGLALASGRERPQGEARLRLGMVLLLGLAILAPVVWDGPRLNLGRALATRALLAESAWRGETGLLERAADLLAGSAAVDRQNARTWYTLGMARGELGDAVGAVEALRAGAQADSRAPLYRYALQDALSGAPTGVDWAGLRRVHSHWTTRYPERAEWYVTQAVALEEGLGDRQGARQLVEQGLARGAEPRAVLERYRDTLRR